MSLQAGWLPPGELSAVEIQPVLRSRVSCGGGVSNNPQQVWPGQMEGR